MYESENNKSKLCIVISNYLLPRIVGNYGKVIMKCIQHFEKLYLLLELVQSYYKTIIDMIKEFCPCKKLVNKY